MPSEKERMGGGEELFGEICQGKEGTNMYYKKKLLSPKT